MLYFDSGGRLGHHLGVELFGAAKSAESGDGAMSNLAIAKRDAPIVPARAVPKFETLQLYTAAAGCCEFRGCAKNLLRHHITKLAGNFAEQAHIYAFSLKGPRGNAPGRPEDIHAPDNLILLCQECHKHIDDEPELFPVDLLKAYKAEHEARIARASQSGPNQDVVVLVVTAPIRGAHVTVPRDDIYGAIAPRFPAEVPFWTIDLSDLDGETENAGFNQMACNKIDREVARLFASGGPIAKTPRIALFAIAPMPILAHLGAKLENKVPLDLYQRHRDTQNWTWKHGDQAVRFVINPLQERPRGAPVAVVLSLSGTVGLSDLPAQVRDTAAIYELTLDGATPAPTFLNHAEDIAAFTVAYHDLLGRIAAEHGYVDAIDLFPAVPAPIAVLLGRERLMKRHPAIRIFDADKDNGGFKFQIEVK